MLQIDHVYEFLYQELFKDFDLYHCAKGVINPDQPSISDIVIFKRDMLTSKKIFFYDQEPFIPKFSNTYIEMFDWQTKYTVEELVKLNNADQLPYDVMQLPSETLDLLVNNPDCLWQKSILATSEYSFEVDDCATKNNFHKLYYFFHGFAAVDWYRGYYTLNYNKQIVKQHNHDFIAFNRIITNDRSYRIYFVSLLKELGLLEHGQVSFNVTDNLFDDWRDEVADTNSKLSIKAKQHIEHHLTDISKLVIDSPNISGSASANIPRTINSWMATSINTHKNVDAFWHVVTETVFYYDKLHLTEKIFKPIVSKQPFMLLAAPGNLAYLKSYGFKTFDSVIDESYDLIPDNDLRVEAVVKQLRWYCDLTPDEKTDIIQQLEPIIDYNFHHFYGEFRHIITRELLDNTKTLFKDLGYDDCHINYANIHHVLTH
jgi:hypothetical protein